MDYPINQAEPLTMHIDLNSCFAMVEQQANRLLRGVPVGVAANLSPGGCVISPSYEAKYRGMKVGFRVLDAKRFCPDIRIIAPDPDKYFHVHKQFVNIFKDYSPHVTPISIDEAVIKFDGTMGLHKKALEDIGYEIKRRMRLEIGDWITCNVGIGPNRFLAKLAASLHKPDGLDAIDHHNLLDIYDQVTLMDLCGINTRYRTRLNLDGGIYTPREFFDAPAWKLWKQVFKSVNGYHWYMRLRGYEVDDLTFERKSYGQSYALHKFTDDDEELSKLIMKLCEKMGRRLRRSDRYATGVSVWCGYRGFPGWGQTKKHKGILYSTLDFHERAMEMIKQRPRGIPVTHLAVSCFGLHGKTEIAPQLFETDDMRRLRIADAMDNINNRYGEYTAHTARMQGLENEIIKRVPFHATSDTLAEMYAEETGAIA